MSACAIPASLLYAPGFDEPQLRRELVDIEAGSLHVDQHADGSWHLEGGIWLDGSRSNANPIDVDLVLERPEPETRTAWRDAVDRALAKRGWRLRLGDVAVLP